MSSALFPRHLEAVIIEHAYPVMIRGVWTEVGEPPHSVKMRAMRFHGAVGINVNIMMTLQSRLHGTTAEYHQGLIHWYYNDRFFRTVAWGIEEQVYIKEMETPPEDCLMRPEQNFLGSDAQMGGAAGVIYLETIAILLDGCDGWI